MEGRGTTYIHTYIETSDESGNLVGWWWGGWVGVYDLISTRVVR